MPQQAYSTNTARVGSPESMEDHIARSGSAAPYRRRRFFAQDTHDDESGAFRDKARRLRRWHESSSSPAEQRAAGDQ